MGKFLRKSRLTLAITLFVQAATAMFVFLATIARRRSFALTALGLAVAEAVAASYLVWQWKEDERDKREIAQQMQENPDSFEIPLDKDATARDFK